jgi:hypothetical protein
MVIFGPMKVCVLTRLSLIALSNFLDFSEFLESSWKGSQNEQGETAKPKADLFSLVRT